MDIQDRMLLLQDIVALQDIQGFQASVAIQDTRGFQAPADIQE